ncbi:hypothetical protein HI914_05007 [Erysiphe necator]|uniref:Putative pinin sdk mema domain-containing protein n=1 Tax=Uncinula necator TaxID=52586 RepID=A0A0B1NX51_UNCNE|nr:hypothetical protein HI914_05007 [Erysiphe necator]KHJ30952.1 putative pinin sdk mema domain-containing protein [Erysiphe necator]
MAENIVPIASAVILPPDPQLTANAPSKRRQSLSDNESKRARLDLDDTPDQKIQSTEAITTNNPTGSGVTDKINERRKSSAVEEKKRGQRLFGGLLNALSQSSQNGPHKKRLEIHKRQLDRANIQKTQDDIQKCGRVTKIVAVQKEEQIKFEEESMHIRHANMHAMANFLHTKTEPKLYYRPWELLPEQKERIDSQIASVSEITKREVSDFSRQNHKGAESKNEEKSNEVSDQTTGEPCIKPRDNAPSPVTHDTNTNDEQTRPKTDIIAEEREREKEEQNGEVMVENEEDIVIY